MAKWLYSIGSFAARKAWAVIAIWVLVIAGVAVGEPLVADSARDKHLVRAGLCSPHNAADAAILDEILRDDAITLTCFIVYGHTNLVLVSMPALTNFARHVDVMDTSLLSPHHLVA